MTLWLHWGMGLALTLVLAAIARADIRALRIPDRLSLPLVAAGLALAAFDPAPALADRLIGAGAGFLLLWGFGEAFFRLRGTEGLGIGDAKLFAAAGAWLGWQVLPPVLLLAAGAGLVWAVLLRKRGPLPFGPFLAAGFWLCWVVLTVAAP